MKLRAIGDRHDRQHTHPLHSVHIKTSNKTRKTIAANLVQWKRWLQAGKRRQRKQIHPRVKHERRASGSVGETDTQNLNKRSYNNNTQNQSIHLRGCVHVQARDVEQWRKHTAAPLSPPGPASSILEHSPPRNTTFASLVVASSINGSFFLPTNESQNHQIYIFFSRTSKTRM